MLKLQIYTLNYRKLCLKLFCLFVNLYVYIKPICQFIVIKTINVSEY
jgi:hypothetical protein